MTDRSTLPDRRRVAALGEQLASIEADLDRIRRLLDTLPAGQLIAITSTLAEHEHRLNTLEDQQ